MFELRSGWYQCGNGMVTFKFAITAIGKLYKSTESWDVLSRIFDPRDPFDTLCESVLEYIRKEKAHNQVVLVIDKCNLIPNWVTICHLPVGDLAVSTPPSPCSQLLLIYEMSVPYIHAQS